MPNVSGFIMLQHIYNASPSVSQKVGHFIDEYKWLNSTKIGKPSVFNVPLNRLPILFYKDSAYEDFLKL